MAPVDRVAVPSVDSQIVRSYLENYSPELREALRVRYEKSPPASWVGYGDGTNSLDRWFTQAADDLRRNPPPPGGSAAAKPSAPGTATRSFFPPEVQSISVSRSVNAVQESAGFSELVEPYQAVAKAELERVLKLNKAGPEWANKMRVALVQKLESELARHIASRVALLADDPRANGPLSPVELKAVHASAMKKVQSILGDLFDQHGFVRDEKFLNLAAKSPEALARELPASKPATPRAFNPRQGASSQPSSGAVAAGPRPSGSGSSQGSGGTPTKASASGVRTGDVVASRSAPAYESGAAAATQLDYAPPAHEIAEPPLGRPVPANDNAIPVSQSEGAIARHVRDGASQVANDVTVQDGVSSPGASHPPSSGAPASRASVVAQAANAVDDVVVHSADELIEALANGHAFSRNTLARFSVEVVEVSSGVYEFTSAGRMLRLRAVACGAGRLAGKFMAWSGPVMLAYDAYQGYRFMAPEADRLAKEKHGGKGYMERAKEQIPETVRVAAPVASTVAAGVVAAAGVASDLRDDLNTDQANRERVWATQEDKRLAAVQQAIGFNDKALAACHVASSLVQDTRMHHKNLPDSWDVMEVLGIVAARKRAIAEDDRKLSAQIARAKAALAELEQAHRQSPPKSATEQHARAQVYEALTSAIGVAEAALSVGGSYASECDGADGKINRARRLTQATRTKLDQQSKRRDPPPSV